MLTNVEPVQESADFLVTSSGLRAEFFTADEVRGMRLGNTHTLVRVLDWCENFLGKPNALLGRSGNVCPFVPEAMVRGSLKLAAVWLKRRGGAAMREIEEMIVACRDYFLDSERFSGKIDIFGSMAIIFPQVRSEEAPMVIDPVQRKLKPSFVQEGLMLGEFHPVNDTPGLRNESFRPLRSPVPLLAIRRMVESDVDFLMAPNDPPPMRVKLLKAYLHFLGPSLSVASQTKARDALYAAEADARAA
jgi:hypothetical protein